MNFKYATYTGILIMMIALISACGGGNSGTPEGSASVESSQTCINCHSGVNSPVVATAKIVDEWLISNHNIAKSGLKYGAGCVDCHEPQVGHPNACGRCHGGVPTATNIIGSDVINNPDDQQKCYKCHHSNTLSSGHFSNSTSANGPGSFVSKNYANKCRACHNPHDVTTLLPINKDWAKSGHGNPNGIAWQYYDFKAQSRTACIRCHTATGFINFVTGAATAFPANTWASSTDKTKETLACNACHETYDFKNSVRKVSQFTAPYGGSTATPGGIAPTEFPNVGVSNLCIPCHAARENGKSMAMSITNYKNISFKNPHYLAAAAVFYGNGGFQFYSSTSQTPYFAQAYSTKYGAIVDGTILRAASASTSNSTPAIVVGDKAEGEKANWSHGKIGINNFQSTKTAAIMNEKKDLVYTGTSGQCVACHMGAGTISRKHTYGAFEVANSTWTANYKGCYGCHTTENIQEIAENDEKPIYDRTMAFFKWQLEQKGLFFADPNPYFFTAKYDSAYTESGSCSKNLPVKNWQSGGTSTFTWTVTATSSSCVSSTNAAGTTGTGPGRMGAAMNYKLLSAEKGAHVHNRTFMKQLIFDSIQYLQTGKVTFSNRYIATGAQTNPNGLINFSAYSSSVTPTGGGLPNDITGNRKSITDLKNYIARKNTGPTPTIGSQASPLYTRP